MPHDRHIMAGAAIRSIFAVLLFGLVAGVAAASPCGGKPVRVHVAEAVDGASLRLADGRVVRLASVIAPLPIDGDPQAIARSKEMLNEIARGRIAQIFIASESTDRYGRILANAVLLEDENWVEAALLARGMVRVVSIADDECMKALLAHERKAQEAKAGIWEAPAFRIFGAQEIEPLLAMAGRFAVVEGTVMRVGESRGRIYLDFGRRFTEDFTIIVPSSLRKLLTGRGIDLKNWRGKRIRVRGILFSWGGPAMEINLAQAIEVLDQPPKSE